jgi:hypothetical protein
MTERAFGFLLLVLAGACGGRLAASDGDAGVDGGTTDAGPHPTIDAGPHPVDGGPPPTFDAGPPPPPPPPVGAFGFVVAQQDDQNGGMAYLSAGFSSKLSRTCALAQPSGSCEIATCGDAMSIGGVSAGTITVAGGTQTPSLMPQATPNGVVYSTFNSAGSIWPPGKPLVVTATGADVPRFQTTFSVAQQVGLLAPTAGAAIDTTSDLVVAWKGAAGATDVFFYLVDASSQTSPTFLACIFPANPQRALVPSALLRQLKSTVTSGNTALAIWPTVRSIVYDAPFYVVASTLGSGVFAQAPLR